MLLQRAEYDAKTKRAYVEFRARDGDAVATTIFSYRTTERLSKGAAPEEVVRMARHLLKKGRSQRPSTGGGQQGARVGVDRVSGSLCWRLLALVTSPGGVAWA